MRLIVNPPEVKAVLREIYEYTADRWGMEQAKKYHKQFKAVFKKLAQNPGLGHMHPDIPDHYRVYPAGSHMVVYYANTRELYIVAIFHQSMDIETHLEVFLNKMTFH